MKDKNVIRFNKLTKKWGKIHLLINDLAIEIFGNEKIEKYDLKIPDLKNWGSKYLAYISKELNKQYKNLKQNKENICKCGHKKSDHIYQGGLNVYECQNYSIDSGDLLYCPCNGYKNNRGLK